MKKRTFIFFSVFILIMGVTTFLLAAPIVITTPKPLSVVQKDKGPQREVLEEDHLGTLSPKTMEEAFEPLVGVSVLGGPYKQYQVPQIRGLFDRRILFIVDGVRQNFRTYHGGSFFFDPWMWKEVVVEKGPSTVLYGNGAVGGVINVSTKESSSFLKGKQGYGGTTALSLQSADGGKTQTGGAYLQQEYYDGLFLFSRHSSNDLRIGGGEHLPYSAFTDRDLLFKGAIFLQEDSFLKFQSHQYVLSSLTPLGPDTVADRPSARERSIQEGSSLSYEREKLFLQLYHQRTTQESLRVVDARRDKRRFETFGLSHRYATSSILQSGMELYTDKTYGERNGKNLGDLPKAQDFFEEFYLVLSPKVIDDLALDVGGRYTLYQFRTSSAKRQGEFLSKSLSLNYQLFPPLKLYYRYSEGVNAPRVQEMMMQGDHFGGGLSTFIPNLNLRPETSSQHEIGWKLEGDHLLTGEDHYIVEQAIYREEVKNYIDDYMNDEGNVGYRNLGHYRFLGQEISFDYFLSDFSLKLSYSMIRGREVQTKFYYDKLPADEGKIYLSYKIRPLALTFGYSSAWVSSQPRVNAPHLVVFPTEKSEGYWPHSAYIQWGPKLKEDHQQLEAQLKFNNFSDKKYRRHGSAYYSLGRDIRLSVRYLF